MEDVQLWQLYTSTMGIPKKNLSDEEKVKLLGSLLSSVGGNREDAILYLECIKATWRPDGPRIGVCGFEPSELIQFPNGLPAVSMPQGGPSMPLGSI
jgi:hypothetical protein